MGLTIVDDIISKIQEELLAFRIDVKNYGEKNGPLIIDGDGFILSYPQWFNNEYGQGVVIQGNQYTAQFTLNVTSAGKLKLSFRGKDKRIDGVRFPLRLYYQSIKIDGKEILISPISVWHDEPFEYVKQVVDGDKFVISIKIAPYNYSKAELTQFILSQYKDDKIISNIDEIVDTLISANSIKQNNYFRHLQNRIKQLESLVKDIANFVGMGDKKTQDILKDAHYSLWTLKSIIEKVQPQVRQEYERVYNAFCASKGCWIGLGSKWASVPTLPHGFHGIFVSGGAKIGKHCVIYQNVTIGSNTIKGSSKNGSPEIGDNVLIGAGAKIIGKIKIGNNVRIGAGCAVAIDIPDDSVVVSQKPIIIHKTNMDNRFYHVENGKFGYVEDGVFHPDEHR